MNVHQHTTAYRIGNGENTALDAEALIALGLFDAVAENIKGAEEGKIVINMDFCKVWELLTSKTLKASELEGDGGLTINKIIDLESQ